MRGTSANNGPWCEWRAMYRVCEAPLPWGLSSAYAINNRCHKIRTCDGSIAFYPFNPRSRPRLSMRPFLFSANVNTSNLFSEKYSRQYLHRCYKWSRFIDDPGEASAEDADSKPIDLLWQNYDCDLRHHQIRTRKSVAKWIIHNGSQQRQSTPNRSNFFFQNDDAIGLDLYRLGMCAISEIGSNDSFAFALLAS